MGNKLCRLSNVMVGDNHMNLATRKIRKIKEMLLPNLAWLDTILEFQKRMDINACLTTSLHVSTWLPCKMFCMSRETPNNLHNITLLTFLKIDVERSPNSCLILQEVVFE